MRLGYHVDDILAGGVANTLLNPGRNSDFFAAANQCFFRLELHGFLYLDMLDEGVDDLGHQFVMSPEECLTLFRVVVEHAVSLDISWLYLAAQFGSFFFAQLSLGEFEQLRACAGEHFLPLGRIFLVAPFFIIAHLVVGQTIDHSGNFAQVVAVRYQLCGDDIVGENLLIAVHDDTALCRQFFCFQKLFGSTALVIARIHQL